MRFVLDINHIREELNELPFRDGKREVFVGRISEVFEEESEQAIADHLRQCEQELRSHTLILIRHEDDRDALFVVQELFWDGRSDELGFQDHGRRPGNGPTRIGGSVARQPIGKPILHLAWVCIGSSSGHVVPDCDDQEQAEGN